jgi:hypothetical protein
VSNRQPVEERFLDKVQREGACWLWTGTVSAGYGRFWLNGKTRAAHRVAYELFVTEIPEGLTIDHVKARGCTSKLCVNPDHLEPVTLEVNCERRSELIERCPKGHSYDEKNTRVDEQGWRRCRRCRADLAIRRRKVGKS